MEKYLRVQAKRDGVLPSIPVLPVSYSTAFQIMSRMKGRPAPQPWQGILTLVDSGESYEKIFRCRQCYIPNRSRLQFWRSFNAGGPWKSESEVGLLIEKKNGSYCTKKNPCSKEARFDAKHMRKESLQCLEADWLYTLIGLSGGYRCSKLEH